MCVGRLLWGVSAGEFGSVFPSRACGSQVEYIQQLSCGRPLKPPADSYMSKRYESLVEEHFQQNIESFTLLYQMEVSGWTTEGGSLKTSFKTPRVTHAPCLRESESKRRTPVSSLLRAFLLRAFFFFFFFFFFFSKNIRCVPFSRIDKTCVSVRACVCRRRQDLPGDPEA